MALSTSSIPFLTGIAQHLLEAGGKRYRPLLAQVAAEIGGAPGDGPVAAGVAVELVHLGSLYHDDVIDEAPSRRGAVSVNANWSNTVAILAGDFLLARASETAASLGIEAVTLLARTYADLCEGQIMELQLAGDTEQGTAGYFRVVALKTAALIRTSARLGAMAGGAPPDQVDAASRWAREVGMAFQIVDDVLDYRSNQQEFGKTIGKDICEGSLTLPVILALESCTPEDRKRLSGMLADSALRAQHLDDILVLVDRYDGTRRALETAGCFAREASDALGVFSGREHVWILSELAQYVVRRRS